VQTCIWPSWCHCHSLSLASVKSRLVLPFWYRLTRVVLDKGPLNGCYSPRHIQNLGDVVQSSVADLGFSQPPPLGRRTGAFTVGLLVFSFALLFMLATANFDRSPVKRALTQNNCHQWLSSNFRVHQICFRLGPRCGELRPTALRQTP